MQFQIGDLVKYRNALLSDTSKYIGYVSKTANNGYEDMAYIEWISHKIHGPGYIYMSKLEKA
jgi:hypothetical protein